MTRILLIMLLCASAIVGLRTVPIVKADIPPVKLNFNAYDSMTVSDCLKAISLETGEAVLPDNSVTGAVGAINETTPTIPEMLEFLKTYEPGLTYQVVYIPGGQNEPDGEQLYQQIQQLKSAPETALVIPSSGDDNDMFIYTDQKYTTPGQQATAVRGMRMVYLVSDSVVRAQMKRAAQSPPHVSGVLPTTAPTPFSTALQSVVADIAQMNPQQQGAAMAQLALAQQQINRTLSPTAISGSRGQYPPHHPGLIAVPQGSTSNPPH
jgi:hypothetical protein